MLRARRFLAVAIAILALGQAAAAYGTGGDPASTSTSAPSPEGLQATPTPTASATASPSPTPTETPTPEPTPTETPEPTETQEPSPTPSESPSPEPTDGQLVVTSRAQRTFVQLGGRLDYTVTVANTGADPLEEVVVVDDVPSEMDVMGVPVIDVEGINLITVGRREQIVWTIGTLPEGTTLQLPWTAVAAASGDLAAVNRVTATSSSDNASVLSRTYLGTAGTPVVDDAPRDRVKATRVRERVVTFVRRPVLPGAAVGASGLLPVTGVDARGWIALGILLVLAGIVVVAIGRRSSIALLAVALMFLAACTGDGRSGDAARPRGTQTDEVLGERIEEGDEDEAPDGTEAGDETEAEPSDTETDADDEPADGEGIAVGADEPSVDGADVGEPPTGFTLVPVERVRVIEVPAPELPVTVHRSRAGDNGISLQWVEESTSISAATSGRSFDPDAPSELLADVSDDGGSMRSVVALRNVTDDQRLMVRGRLVLDVLGSNGTRARMTSGRIETTLEPGGEITASFSFLLPSDTYSLTPYFEAG